MELSPDDMRILWRMWFTEWFPVVLMSLFIGFAISYWLVTSGHIDGEFPWVFLPSAVIPAGIFVLTYPRRSIKS